MATMIPVRVAGKRVEATDIVSFRLRSVDGSKLPAFTAGSHIDVKTPHGVVRQYSLCNDPSQSDVYEIAVLKELQGRGGSASMHERLNEGDVIEISAPKNHFELTKNPRRSLLLAGGIGITPIICMAEQLSSSKAPFEFHYFGRSVDRMAYIDRIKKSPFADSVDLHAGDSGASSSEILESLLKAKDKYDDLYVCGPKGFINAVIDGARSNGWQDSQIHYEFFAGEVVHCDADAAFEVRIASTGATVTVGAKETVVEALQRIGISVDVSCGQGVCGTCTTRVIQGTPDHRDMFLLPEEQARNDQFTPCCSRSKSPILVLDL